MLYTGGILIPLKRAKIMSEKNLENDRVKIIPTLAIVVPCYNEEDVINITVERLLLLLTDLQSMNRCSTNSFLVFVDDGSGDTTWSLVMSAVRKNSEKVRGIRLTRNFGHQAAIMAGLAYVKGKCNIVITIDADLQDDIGAIQHMIDKYQEGNEIVLGVRWLRESDSFFKRWTAIGYYRLMRLLGVNLVVDHADFRMISARALEYLEQFPEYHMFLRAIVMMLYNHNRIGTVIYDRSDRIAGESKYNLRKMVDLGLDGITSFSVLPLRIIMFIGMIIFVFAIILAIYSFVAKLMDTAIPGWASISIPLYLVGGLVMFSLGIIGEYIGKIFIEVKRRPRFLIDEVIESDKLGQVQGDE